MTLAVAPLFGDPILNSPYEQPMRDHVLDAVGQSLDEPPRDGRRRLEFVTPVSKPRKEEQRADRAQDRIFAT